MGASGSVGDTSWSLDGEKALSAGLARALAARHDSSSGELKRFLVNLDPDMGPALPGDSVLRQILLRMVQLQGHGVHS